MTIFNYTSKTNICQMPNAFYGLNKGFCAIFQYRYRKDFYPLLEAQKLSCKHSDFDPLMRDLRKLFIRFH